MNCIITNEVAIGHKQGCIQTISRHQTQTLTLITFVPQTITPNPTLLPHFRDDNLCPTHTPQQNHTFSLYTRAEGSGR